MRFALVRSDGRVAGIVVVQHAQREVKAPPGHVKVELADGQYCEVNARYNGVSFAAPGVSDDAPDISLEARLALIESRVIELEARPGNGGDGPPNQPNSQQPK